MSKVIVTKSKLDNLANAISNKSGEPVTMTLDEMVSAVDGIELGVTPTGNINITQAGVTDVTQYATATVAEGDVFVNVETEFLNLNNQRKCRVTPNAFIYPDDDAGNAGYIADYYNKYGDDIFYDAIPVNTSVTPTESSQTIGGYKTMLEGAVTVNAIPSNYVGSGITRRDGDDVTVIDDVIYAQKGYYENMAVVWLGNVLDQAEPSATASFNSSTGVITATASVAPYNGGSYSTENDYAYVNKSLTDTDTLQLTTRSSSDLSASGATVTAPSGYYASSASKSVASGSLGVAQTNISKTSLDYDIDIAFPSFTAGYISTSPTALVSLDIEDKSVTPSTSQQVITPTDTDCYLNSVTVSAMPSGTEGTPTATKGTVSNHAISVTPSVTNTAGYISGGTHNGTAVSVSASELVSGTVNITASGNTDVTNYATASVASGSATASATKGTVSNHSVTVTPSVTRTAGYITAGSANGTAVTVSASELVSGSQTVTSNDTYDVTNLAELVVNVSGGGSSSVSVGTKTATPSGSTSMLFFSGLLGQPTSFVVTSSTDQATGGTTAVAVVYDGTSLHGMDITTQAEADTGFTQVYANGELTISATDGAAFQPNEYKLVYTYGGTSSDIHTADVQVGSGATSITFSGLSGRPVYFSCRFKSTFSTSSGYQRVMEVVNDGTSTYGHALDSSAKALTSWSYTYSGGSLTISSTGTNNGGYFHQPGYYQLTYAVDSSAPQYETVSKTYRASTSAQSETITPSSGYDAIEEVSISVPAVTQTNLTAANIKSGTTVSISNGSTNLWSVTGTYTGGGSGTVNIDTKTATASNYPVSLSFTSMKGEPKAFFLRATSQISSSGSTTYYYIIDMRYNGTDTTGNCFRIGSTRQVNNITSGYSWSYSGTTLTITSSASSRSYSPGAFNNTYELVYVY